MVVAPEREGEEKGGSGREYKGREEIRGEGEKKRKGVQELGKENVC